MFTGMLHLHIMCASLLILVLLVKVSLMYWNRQEMLSKINKATKIPHIVISVLLVSTGIFLALNSGIISAGYWFIAKLIIVIAAIPLSIIAVKKNNKYLGALSLMAFIFAYGLAETKTIGFNSNKTSGETAMTGKSVYEAHCQICHGSDGTLGLSGAKNLSTTTLSHSEMVNIITNGKNAMMAYKNVLSKQEIELVAKYITSLK